MRGAVTIMVALVLVAIILGAGAWFIYQQKQKTEKNFLGKIWDQLFPSQTESIVIPGTTVGGGCGVKKIANINTLAAAVADCWKKGDGHTMISAHKVDCCYKIDPSSLTTILAEKALETALTGRNVDFDWNIEANLDKSSAQFTLCFDTAGRNEVYLTRNPGAKCQ